MPENVSDYDSVLTELQAMLLEAQASKESEYDPENESDSDEPSPEEFPEDSPGDEDSQTEYFGHDLDDDLPEWLPDEDQLENDNYDDEYGFLEENSLDDDDDDDDMAWPADQDCYDTGGWHAYDKYGHYDDDPNLYIEELDSAWETY
jgi:hypothetical protein